MEDTIGMQPPLSFLWYAAKYSDDYSEILRSTLAAKPSTPSTPWNLILYQDGVDPGDSAGTKHTRHSVVFY